MWGDEYILVTCSWRTQVEHKVYKCIIVPLELIIFLIIIYSGLQFWRIGSRKIFAVRSSDLYEGKGNGKAKVRNKKTTITIDSSSDTLSEEDIYVTARKSKGTVCVSEVMTELKCLRKVVNEVMTLTKGMKLPPSLYIQLKQTFQCNICHQSPITPPVIYTKCCKNSLGCEQCVDCLYSNGEGRTRNEIFIFQLEGGREWKRHANQIRKRPENIVVDDQDSIEDNDIDTGPWQQSEQLSPQSCENSHTHITM